jgi:hypothetical protein
LFDALIHVKIFQWPAWKKDTCMPVHSKRSILVKEVIEDVAVGVIPASESMSMRNTKKLLFDIGLIADSAALSHTWNSYRKQLNNVQNGTTQRKFHSILLIHATLRDVALDKTPNTGTCGPEGS